MNRVFAYGIAAIIGLVVGAAVIYGFLRQQGAQRPSLSCANIVPANTSTVYGFDLTDSQQELVTGIIHFYPPGGFHHNVAYMYDSSGSGQDQAPVAYNMSNCDSSLTSKMTNDGGTPLSDWTFSQGSGNATWSVTVEPDTGAMPKNKMTGNLFALTAPVPQ